MPLGERRSLVIVSVEGRRLLLGLTPGQIYSHGVARAAGPGNAAFGNAGHVVPAPTHEYARTTWTINVDGIGAVSAPLQIVLLLTLLSFLPAILVTMTSFTRIAIVFHFLRQALGTQEMPSNQILIGLTLFLTMFIMAPVARADQRAGASSRRWPGRSTVTEALDARRAAAARRSC